MKNLNSCCLHSTKKPQSLINNKLRFLFLSLLNFYQTFVSGTLGGTCRFEPSCSNYAKHAFITHSNYCAFILVLKRLAKCHPFGAYGYDPVPRNHRKEENHA